MTWERHPEFAQWEEWEAVGDNWPPKGPERCLCGAKVHWVTRKVIPLETPIDGKMKAYRYTVIHGMRDTRTGGKPEQYPRPEVADHKRRASGEAA